MTNILSEPKNTKERIMLEASILFAHRGYAAVSMRDIAERVDIKASSIYNHFKNKEALFTAIVTHIKNLYIDFFARTDLLIAKAKSFRDVLDCLCGELRNIPYIFIFYGVSLITMEQFRYPYANEVFGKTLVKRGIEYSRSKFDMCIEKGWVEPFDTLGLATLFNNNILVGTLIRTHEDMQNETWISAKDMFETMYDYVLSSVTVIES